MGACTLSLAQILWKQIEKLVSECVWERESLKTLLSQGQIFHPSSICGVSATIDKSCPAQFGFLFLCLAFMSVLLNKQSKPQSYELKQVPLSIHPWTSTVITTPAWNLKSHPQSKPQKSKYKPAGLKTWDLRHGLDSGSQIWGLGTGLGLSCFCEDLIWQPEKWKQSGLEFWESGTEIDADL